jgi:hypothetical protein|tara:strand:- start:277 stop:795 length:519 start_codon:yes stop_codon:yes gene_type:complete
MIVNLFSVPILIGNINLDKIKINNEKFENKWASSTKTSHGFKNTIDTESQKYMGQKFASLLETLLKEKFTLKLMNIWENIYEKDSFQEPHTHGASDFSFIVYKKINESQTVFFHPGKNAIQCLNTLPYFQTDQRLPLREGQFVIFPSFLEHMVLRSNNQSTISGNLLVEPVE